MILLTMVSEFEDLTSEMYGQICKCYDLTWYRCMYPKYSCTPNAHIPLRPNNPPKLPQEKILFHRNYQIAFEKTVIEIMTSYTSGGD